MAGAKRETSAEQFLWQTRDSGHSWLKTPGCARKCDGRRMFWSTGGPINRTIKQRFFDFRGAGSNEQGKNHCKRNHFLGNTRNFFAISSFWLCACMGDECVPLGSLRKQFSRQWQPAIIFSYYVYATRAQCAVSRFILPLWGKQFSITLLTFVIKSERKKRPTEITQKSKLTQILLPCIIYIIFITKKKLYKYKNAGMNWQRNSH